MVLGVKGVIPVSRLKMKKKLQRHYNEPGTYLIKNVVGKVIERVRTKYAAELMKTKLEKIYGDLVVEQVKPSVKGGRK